MIISYFHDCLPSHLFFKIPRIEYIINIKIVIMTARPILGITFNIDFLPTLSSHLR